MLTTMGVRPGGVAYLDGTSAGMVGSAVVAAVLVMIVVTIILVAVRLSRHRPRG